MPDFDLDQMALLPPLALDTGLSENSAMWSTCSSAATVRTEVQLATFMGNLFAAKPVRWLVEPAGF
jgi:hypothetical protein